MDALDNASTLPPRNDAATALSLDEVMDAIARAHEESMDADETVVALRHAKEEIETLKEALRTRTTIGQAVGLLMYRSTITAEEAFAQLVGLSSHSNVKLRDIARRLVAEANDKAGASQGASLGDSR
jgi:hypothetical protein